MIYDSPWCRVSFSPSFERDLGKGSVYCHYGRLHAPDDGVHMEWQGERCIAWPNISYREYYCFLEGCTAEEAAERERRRSEWSCPVLVDR